MSRYFGCEPEVSWGTAVTPVTRFFEAISESVQMEREYETLETFGVNSVRDVAELSSVVSGDVEIAAGYEGIGILYEYLIGSSETSGSDPYTHLFPHSSTGIPDTDREDKSLTLEFKRDESLFWVYPGAFITSLSHSFSLDSSSRISVGFLAKNETTATAKTGGGSVSFATFTPIKPTQITVEVDDSLVCAQSVSIEIENPLDEPFCMGETGLSVQPERSGSLKVTGSAELIFEDFTEYAKWGSDTPVKMEVICTGPSGVSLKYEMTKTRITQITPHMSGRDRLTATMEWEAIYDSDAEVESLVVTLVNGDDAP